MRLLGKASVRGSSLHPPRFHRWLQEVVSNIGPRRWPLCADGPTFHIFGDASEPGDLEASPKCAGILCLGAEQPLRFFSVAVPTSFLQLLKARKKQIGILELLWPVLALLLWQPYLKGKHAIYFEDNEGAKYGLPKGFSKHWDINTVRALFWTGVSMSHSAPWFERIASEDNPADTLTKPGMSVAHLCGAIDDSGMLLWDRVFDAIGECMVEQTLPTWQAAASFYCARFQ